MIGFNFLWLLMGVYAVGLGRGLSVSLREPRRRRSRSWITLLGAMTCAAVFIAAWGTRGTGAAVLGVPLLGAAFLILSFGLGALAGTLACRYTSGNLLVVAGGLALLVPTVLATWTIQDISAYRALQAVFGAERMAEFRLGEVEGQIAGYEVRLPASPQIQVWYGCPRRGDPIGATCRAVFDRQPGLTRAVGDVAVFRGITLRQKGEGCGPFCLTFEELEEWCQARPDLEATPWCEAVPMEALSLGPESLHRVDGTSWTELQVGDDGISFGCVEHRKGRQCEAWFEVARGVIGAASFQGVLARDLPSRAEAARGYARRIWAAMTAM